MARISLKEAEKFHGHLGPWLVLGLLAGESALKRLGSRKYFGLKVKVRGVTQKPKSCLVDGLQLSTGATYGKGNIAKSPSGMIEVSIASPEKQRSLSIRLKAGLIKELKRIKGHSGAEALARKLYKTDPDKIFIYRNRARS